MHKLVAEHVYAKPVKGKFGNQAVHYTRCGGGQLALAAVWVTLKSSGSSCCSGALEAAEPLSRLGCTTAIPKL